MKTAKEILDSRENALENGRRLREYEMKILKISGYLADYYIDRAIESDDFSQISGLLIDKFEKTDLSYLIAKYKEFELDKKIEDVDIDINEWVKIQDWVDNRIVLTTEKKEIINMPAEDYVNYLIELRKNDTDEE